MRSGPSRAVKLQPVRTAPAAGGTRKGEETRQRILDAALKVFGTAGLKGATTRQIAEEAGVALPALAYYFGGKDGLYLACAQEIVDRYGRHMLALLSGVRASLKAPMSAASARARLKEVLWALVDLQIANREADIWMSFVLREIAEQGPAFDILFKHLWAPGVDITAELIGRIVGERSTSPAAKIQALLLISSLSAFSIARPIALRYLDWPDTGDARLARIKSAIGAQVERIA
ncbi:MAG: CerR family C-terminal domain-containing protein [Xanthobacteraceae bacterium]|nr:CerR family C-terminal domain-containing protein [Xanthobacteraceae bacterium]